MLCTSPSLCFLEELACEAMILFKLQRNEKKPLICACLLFKEVLSNEAVVKDRYPEITDLKILSYSEPISIQAVFWRGCFPSVQLDRMLSFSDNCRMGLGMQR